MPQGRKERPAAERGHRRKPAQSLAGVGIGSFYEYFSSKDDLAAVCIHLWIKEISTAMRASIEATRDRPLSERVESLILAQMSAPLQRPRDWAALFRLERRMSGMKEFRRMYGRFVRLHEEALLSGPGWPADAPPATSAFAVHAIVMAWCRRSSSYPMEASTATGCATSSAPPCTAISPRWSRST